MRHKIILSACALAACASVAGARASKIPVPTAPGASLAAARAVRGGGQEQKEAKVSGDEQKAAQKIEAAATPDAKLKAAAEFVKKYPKSSLRAQVAEGLAAEVAAVPDPAQRIELFKSFLTTFNDPATANRVYPTLLDTYLKANRLDDAFSAAGGWLEKNPNEVTWRTQLALTGIVEAQRKNPKFVQQSRQYAQQAIALMEADKKPDSSDEVQWKQFKTQWLPQLYQAQGVIAFATGDTAGAKANAEKAASLGITDPNTYVILAELADMEYEKLAREYKAASPGATQDAALQKALTQLDRVIELFAQAVAAAEAKPEYQALRDQLMQSLTSYYKYRKGSDAGLQELIAKYKKAPSQ